MRLNVDTRFISNEHFIFRPNPGAPLEHFGNELALKNPAEDFGADTWSARLFIGFNVGDVPTITLDDVVNLVVETRTTQGLDPDATFFATRGTYTERRTGKASRLIVEDGCQIVFINTEQTSEDFQKAILDLAQSLVVELAQDAIFVEVQHNGLSKRLWRITP